MQIATQSRERWSLRTQFIVPLAATIVIVAALVTLIAWLMASSAAKADTIKRLTIVHTQCSSAKYPLNSSVVNQIKAFSGIDITILDKDQRVVLSSLSVFDTDETARSVFENVALNSGIELRQVSIGSEKYDFIAGKHISQPFESPSEYFVLMANQSDRVNVMWDALWPPAITGLFSVAAMALVATIIASQVVRRIERMELQVERIALGTYDISEVDGPDDAITRLSGSVNKMSQQLALAHEKIAKSERSRLINLVASGMAHQLRNSLAGAILLLQTFLRSQNNNDAQELFMALNQLKLAKESIRSLLAVNTDLEFSDYVDLSIQEIHSSLQSYVQVYADHHQVNFTIETTGNIAEEKIRRGAAIVGALMNLVMNAIEATGPGGQVQCQLESRPSQDAGQIEYLWRIIDNGPGPKPEIVDSMLEPFVTSKSEGVGLGLPMANRIAQQFHGRLSWHRENEKTAFEFLISEPKPQ